MRSRALVWLAILGLGIALAWFGRASVLRGQVPAATAETARVVERDFDSVVKATGVIKPMLGSEVRVGTQLSSVVRRLHVHTGDRVKRGQLLIELDSRTLQARRNQANAALASSEASSAYADSDWQKQRELARNGAISQGALELVERGRTVAKALVEENKAQLAYAEAQLVDARIVSPISGVVAAVNVRQGELVPPDSASGLVTVIDLERLEVWAYVDETDIGRIQPRQAARFSVDTYPDQEFTGEVETVYPKPEIRDNVVNYVACIRFTPSSAHVLRPEMTTNVRIILERRAQTLAVPRRAVHREQGENYVLLAGHNTSNRRVVTLGVRDDNYVEVIKGLKLGDTVSINKVSTEEPK